MHKRHSIAEARHNLAQTNQLVLVTFNTADYDDFVSLTVEDGRA